MFCPNCKAEYVKGITTCPECNVSLVERLVREPEAKYTPSDVELVTVLETSDETILVIAKSILEGEGIKCLVLGDTWQDLWGLGGTGFTPYVKPIKIQVAKADEEDARKLLKGMADKR